MYVCMYVWFFFSAFFSAFVFWMGLGRIGDQLSYSNAICDCSLQSQLILVIFPLF